MWTFSTWPWLTTFEAIFSYFDCCENCSSALCWTTTAPYALSLAASFIFGLSRNVTRSMQVSSKQDAKQVRQQDGNPTIWRPNSGSPLSLRKIFFPGVICITQFFPKCDLYHPGSRLLGELPLGQSSPKWEKLVPDSNQQACKFHTAIFFHRWQIRNCTKKHRHCKLYTPPYYSMVGNKSGFETWSKSLNNLILCRVMTDAYTRTVWMALLHI